MRLLKVLLTAWLALLMSLPALGGQATYTMPTTGPSTFAEFLTNSLNPALAAVVTNNSGATAPAVTGQPATYQWWADTSASPTILKIYDGTSWLSIATLDTAGHLLGLTGNNLTVTGTTVPTNGVYLPAANTLGLSANSAAEIWLTSTVLSPAVSDGSALGSTALPFSDLSMATGAVVNIANDWIATHTAGILTVGTGDLRVSTAGTNAASAVTVGGTQTLTNKTYDTAGTGNSFSINGLAATTNTGTGAVVRTATPTITTPVLTGLPTGTGVAAGATASTLASRDASANLSADNFLTGYTTTATAAGTTTLTVDSTQFQFFTGSTTQTVTLPVTSTLVLGQEYVIVNNSTGAVTINSSGNNAVVIVAAGTWTRVEVILTSGTSAASWNALYSGTVVTSAKKLTVSNTLTLAGTDATTMTFPTTSATIARTDAANTFTGVQTMTSPALTTPAITGLATGTGVASAATASTLASRDSNANLNANNHISGFTTTATAAGTTTLTVSSTALQFFTGVTTQTVTLPVTSTLVLGQQFTVVNQSSGTVTVNSSGSNLVLAVAAGNTGIFTTVLTSGTSAASWQATYIASGAGTGTVTSVTCGTGLTGGTITLSGTCDLTVPVTRANGGTQSTTGAVIKVVRQVFTASGTYTPTTGMLYADIECVGGGGGGGGVDGGAGYYAGGGGGGSGGYSKIVVTAATIGASKAVTIGALGAGGTAGANNGTAGGATNVGTTICVANGGGGGFFNDTTTGFGGGGTGATAGTGDLAATGNYGWSGNGGTNITSWAVGGQGAPSVFGGSASKSGNSGAAIAGRNAGVYGAGGNGASVAGGSNTNGAGGDGSAGIVIITEYVNQ